MNTKFKRDLALGQKYEQHFAKEILKENYKFPPDGYHPQYDLEHDGKYYEVKHDGKAKITGNVYIEYACRYKPSGITLSISDYYIVYIPTDTEYKIYQIPTEDLRNLIKQKKYFRTNISGGDGLLSKGHLFKETTFKDYLKCVCSVC